MKAILLATALSVWAFPVLAQGTPCGPYTVMIEKLIKSYGEELRSVGLAGGGSIAIQIWANLETGTWTVMRRQGDIGCALGSGQEYREYEKIELPNMDEEL